MNEAPDRLAAIRHEAARLGWGRVALTAWLKSDFGLREGDRLTDEQIRRAVGRLQRMGPATFPRGWTPKDGGYTFGRSPRRDAVAWRDFRSEG